MCLVPCCESTVKNTDFNVQLVFFFFYLFLLHAISGYHGMIVLALASADCGNRNIHNTATTHEKY